MFFVVALILATALMAFSINEFIFRRDALIENGDVPPTVTSSNIGDINKDYSIKLEGEDIDGSFLYSIIDSTSKKVIKKFNYLPYQERRPLYEQLGNGDYIIAKKVILKNGGEIINITETFDTLFWDYSIFENYIAYISPDTEANRANDEPQAGLACNISLIDLSKGYQAQIVDKFVLPYELSFNPKLNIAYDNEGILYYDYYNEVPQIKVYDVENEQSSVYLEKAMGVLISPYDSYMIYGQLNSTSKDDRSNETMIIHNLVTKEEVSLPAGHIAKVFWDEKRAIIFNDHTNVYDIFNLENWLNIGTLDAPFQATKIEKLSGESYRVHYYDYNQSNVIVTTKEFNVKSTK